MNLNPQNAAINLETVHQRHLKFFQISFISMILRDVLITLLIVSSHLSGNTYIVEGLLKVEEGIIKRGLKEILTVADMKMLLNRFFGFNDKNKKQKHAHHCQIAHSGCSVKNNLKQKKYIYLMACHGSKNIEIH